MVQFPSSQLRMFTPPKHLVQPIACPGIPFLELVIPTCVSKLITGVLHISKHRLIIDISFMDYQDFVIYISVRIRVRVHLPQSFVCRKRRLNEAVLRTRAEKPRSGVTTDVE
jgi:hypothetical protein